MKTRRSKTMGRRLMASLLAVVMLLGTLWVPAGAAESSSQPEGYVTDNLVFWLDANTNTGSGYDAEATQWVNLVNTDEKVDVSGFDWGTDAYGNHYLDMDGGYFKLPDTVRQALMGQNFTIEFLMRDYISDPASKTRNIMVATGDDAWLAAQTKAVGTVNDNFVLFMNSTGQSTNNSWFCFRTCYNNGNGGWTSIYPNSSSYCTGTYAGTSDMTNTLTFDYDGKSYWYQDGVQVGSCNNNGHTISLDGFQTTPGTKSTWQTERKPQIIFGTNTDTLASREEFVAKVQAIRIYTDSLTADEAAQNAAVDEERYYTNPYMTQEYVTDDLVLWLDASNNTGAGFDEDATEWVNLVNMEQTVDVSDFTWGTDERRSANYLELEDGWIILPDEVRQAMSGESFTVEFLMEGYDGAPHANIRNLMNATGDDAWLDSLTGPVATPNDNFVIFMNQSGGNNNGKFCFRTCYLNSSNGWSNMTNSTDYCKVTGTEINDVTNSITFKSGGSTIWYLDGASEASTTNSEKLIGLDGFRTTPATASTWQTERKPQITFGTDNNVIANRAPFAAKVKAIRVYKDELTADEVAQNAAADQERYYTDPYNKVPDGYVEDGLVLFLDAINNTGDGHSDTAEKWINLADTIGDPATFFNGTGTSYTWSETGLKANGGIVLPDEALAAAAGSNFTIEFLLNEYDATVQSSVTRNLLVLIGPDGTSGVWDDDFVCFQNSTAANPANAHQWCFDIKNASHTKYGRISVTAADVNGVTNAITFDHDVQVQWLQDGVAKSTGNSGAAANWVTDINLTDGTQLIFGAAPGYMSGKAFAANVKSIRVYNRTLTASELSQNAEMDAARYINAGKLAELAKDSWNEVLVGNPSATTAAKLESFAESVMGEVAAQYLDVSVVDNKDGTFTFTYEAKETVDGYTPISYTLYVDCDYEVDFSTMTAEEQAEFLKDTYAHELGSKMSLAFTDGALVYDVTNTARPVSGLYLPVYYSGNEYVWEMEIAYARDSGSTWAGQLFAVKDLETPQYTCTYNIAAETGTAAYEFCKRTKPDLWANHVTTTLGAANFGEGKLDASKFNASYSAKDNTTFTLKYVVKDGVAFGFIDDVLVVEASNLDTDLSGTFGINSAGPTLKVKSIKISTDVSGEQVFSSIGHYNVDIYEPETAITIAPSVMQMADSETYDISDETKRPASIIYDVKAENGELNAYDGATKLGTFHEMYTGNNGKALVGVRIDDKAAADLLIAYSAATKNQNLWVFSADGELLQYINESSPLIRGVVEISAADLADIVDDDAARTAVYDKVYGYGHRTVVIPVEAASEEVVRELQSMKLAVIVEGYGLTEAEIYDVVVSGPAGILTDDYAAVINMLESFDDYTLVRPSLVVGHRGDRTYPDNSIESIVSAAKSGAAAAEFDVIATLDGYLVLSHDNDNYEAVEYRNGTWAGTSITGAYWKKENAEAAGSSNYFEGRYYHTSTSQTPVLYATLDQLFDATGTQYPGLTYHIEVKDSRNDPRPGMTGKIAVNLIDELLRSEKYSDLRGRCDILCFDTGINYPSTEKGYAVHNQNSKTVTDNMANSIYTYESFYRPINSLLEPGTNVVTIPTLETFKHYGMICCPWTYNNGGLYQAYIMGYHGFTTDYPHVSDDIYKQLVAEVDDKGNVTVEAYKLADHLNASPIDVTDDGNAEIVAVTNKDNVKISGMNVSIKPGVTATADVAVRYWMSLPSASGSQKGFWLYSPSFEISGTAEDDEEIITISILGDSISTFEGVSNNTSYNTTLANGNVYYHGTDRGGVKQADTWWQQTIDQMDLELLVNNSWSGSAISHTRYECPAAYISRSENLHNDNLTDPEDPDIIAVFLGTNDFTDEMGKKSGYKALGTTPDYDTLITKNSDGTYTYATPTTVAECYAIMIHKATVRYPNAELYCLSLLPRENQSDAYETKTLQYNAMFKSIAEHFGGYFVDQYHDSGITEESFNFDYYMYDSLHPGKAGMDAMTNSLVSAIQMNSKYSTVKDKLYEVSYTLNGRVVLTAGTDKTAVAGETFSVSFVEQSGYEMDVTVTMGGTDITAACYADNVITIPNVSGDVVITATAKTVAETPIENTPKNFLWEYDAASDAMVNVTDSTFSANSITKTNGSITDGTLKTARFTLGEAIILNHDQPWSVEWKSEGDWKVTGNGALFLSEENASNASGNRYLYRRTNADFFAIGEYSGTYNHYGVNVADHVSNHTAEHVWRLTNRIAADGSNMVYLYVDGVEVGPMNRHYVAGSYQNATSNWISGKNFAFKYLGTNNHTISGCSIDYIKVWEAGIPEKAPANYRWEYKSDNEPLSSVVDAVFSENNLTAMSGSVSNGVLSNAQYYLENHIVLEHDRPWSIEWKGTGDWSNSNNGGLLFAEAADGATTGARYLFRRSGNNFIALGERGASSYQNYGVSLAGIDSAAEHVWRMTNVVAPDGSNMVYFYVDGREIGPMNQYYVNVTAKNTTSNWVSGKDFVFNYIGTKAHTLSKCSIEYVQVWEDGIPVDKSALEEAVTAAKALTKADYTTATWAAVEKALTAAEAELANDDALQANVDAAEKALEEAVAALVKRGDKADLAALVEEVKALTEADYTADTWAAVEKALGAAEAELADADALQADLDAAEKALEEAVDALAKRADKSDLKAIMDSAAGLKQDQYTSKSWKALEDAMAAAQAVMDDVDAQQSAVDEAEAALLAAIEGLVGKAGTVVYYYAVKVEAGENGTVTASTTEAKAGKTITLTVKPAAGYKLADLTITDANGKDVPWATEGDEIVFVMPAAAVTVKPVFTLGGNPVVDSDNFIDVEDDDWFAAAVDYAAANGLMTGTSTITFSPYVDTSRGMIVTILYSLEGKPAVSGQGMFDDVNEGDWYADPVNWAAANGIVAGYGNGKFGPNDPITREQLAAILRTYANYKGWDISGKADLSGYADAAAISPWAETAMAWAVDKGLISGKGNGILDPTGTAIRAEVAQVLKNFVEQF